MKVEGVTPGGGLKKTQSEVIENNCQTQQICKEDAVDCRRWRRLITDVV